MNELLFWPSGTTRLESLVRGGSSYPARGPGLVKGRMMVGLSEVKHFALGWIINTYQDLDWSSLSLSHREQKQNLN